MKRLVRSFDLNDAQLETVCDGAFAFLVDGVVKRSASGRCAGTVLAQLIYSPSSGQPVVLGVAVLLRDGSSYLVPEDGEEAKEHIHSMLTAIEGDGMEPVAETPARYYFYLTDFLVTAGVEVPGKPRHSIRLRFLHGGVRIDFDGSWTSRLA